MSKKKYLQIETFDSDKLLSEFKRIHEKLNQLSNKKIASKQENNKLYYSRKEVKEMLGVSYPTLNAWKNRGILKPCRIGSRLIYKLEDIEKAMIPVIDKKYNP